jgi:hypothetical protein
MLHPLNHRISIIILVYIAALKIANTGVMGIKNCAAISTDIVYLPESLNRKDGNITPLIE